MYTINMAFSKSIYEQWRAKMMEERKNYLDLAHTKESEVRMWTFQDSIHRGREYFFIDGFRVWMPEYLQFVHKYKRHLFWGDI